MSHVAEVQMDTKESRKNVPECINVHETLPIAVPESQEPVQVPSTANVLSVRYMQLLAKKVRHQLVAVLIRLHI